ncbi:glycosyltransferase [Halopseudomonas pachastrellae]|uniref:glycosyltransferase n=1 Tax=Halopseudomonas pachastrellae TaxID=254161 RepID=UPI003D7EF320
MISIVICSIDPARLRRVQANIETTVGVPYEVVAIDNRVRSLGLCEAYNEGAQKARFDLICFLHEDVEFLERDWGAALVSHFRNDPKLGLVGLAGSRYKSGQPSGWSNGWGDDICVHIWHGQPGDMVKTYEKPADLSHEPLVRVAALDGVFLCSPKNVWNEIRFSSALSGFHFYDVDYSLRVAQRYHVAVVYDISLLHFSLGSFSNDWARQALSYANKAPVALPYHVLNELTAADYRMRERATVRYWLKLLRKNKLPLLLRWRWLANSGCLRFPGLWWLALKFAVKSK